MPSNEEGFTAEQHEDLLRALIEKEMDLLAWICQSDDNARWFAADPMSAIRAAKLGIEDNILHQLELITRSIGQKLRYTIDPRQQRQ